MAKNKVKVVRVHADNTVDPDPCHLSKKNGDVVVWATDDGQARSVDFDKPEGSPFTTGHFPVPRRGARKAGPVRLDAAENGYKYTVSGGGVPDVDPQIIVDP